MASSAQIHVLGGSVAPSSSMKTSNYSSAKTVFFGWKLNNNSAFGLPHSAFLKCRRKANNFAVAPVKVVSEKVVGIDLGTTNSAVAAMEGGKPTIVTNAEGQRTTRSVVAYTKFFFFFDKQSVVAYTKSDDRLVRQIAKRQAVVNLENTFFSVKRFIGRKIPEVDEESKQVSYRVVRDDQTCTRSLTARPMDFQL